ncbi:MAG TPA: sulfite exporter TauE/SafE family protein [Acidobacteriaceae bacterium]|nr:sulfite exporter TauE/SafE family protein [Acidobacteriaceae bacterium]
MEYLAGFIIAVVIALTGVGAGTITAPLLILFLHIPPGIAVGTALAYSAAVKLIVAPVQMFRRLVDYRVLAWMLAGGLPGVILGSLFFRHVAHKGQWGFLYWVLGGIIIFSSSWHIYRYFRPNSTGGAQKKSFALISAIMLPIGAEVGFSSSGAGALGTVALMSLTPLSAAQVVGTDLAFGLGIALVGSGIHMLGGTYDGALLLKMIAGGILGAIVGSNIAPRVPSRQLRLALSLWLLVIGAQFCWHAASL